MFPLDHSRQFSLSNARALAKAAQLAYSDPTYAKARAFSLGAKAFIPVQVGKITAYVITDGVCIEVIYRGTDCLRNWLTDADGWPRRFGKVHIHGGFLAASDLSWALVCAAIETLRAQFGSLPVYFTGHSLGGALAAFGAYRWACGAKQVQAVYTFGQPRVGNAVFAAHYESLGILTFRIVDREDIVCRLPFLCGYYRHTRGEVFLDESHRMNFDMPAWQKIPSDAQGIIGGLWLLHKFTWIDDHFMHEYVETLSTIELGHYPNSGRVDNSLGLR